MRRIISGYLAALPAVCIAGCAGGGSVAEVYGGYFIAASGGSDSNAGTILMPFATFSRAQSAMRASGLKTLFLRAGTYTNAAVYLTSADSGETWETYPPDGCNSAILDGGATDSATGGNTFTIDGASNVVVTCLRLQNFQQWGIGIHGENQYYNGGQASGFFPNNVPPVVGTRIVNNIITTGYSTLHHDVIPFCGVLQIGQVISTLIANNVIENCYGGGITAVTYFNSAAAVDSMNGLTISGNAILNTNITYGDSGAIYLADRATTSHDITITNNFIRDYQTGLQWNGQTPKTDHAIYFDLGTQNVMATGNVIANTANPISGNSSLASTMPFFCGSCTNVKFQYNIVDIGNGSMTDCSFDFYQAPPPFMTGDVCGNNIFIGNFSGSQSSYGFGGTGPYAFPIYNGLSLPLPNFVVAGNMYYNYGSGSMSTLGNVFSDSSPTTTINPLFDTDNNYYQLQSVSPAYNSPANFQPILGSYGPPGYIIPPGTSPSYRSD